MTANPHHWRLYDTGEPGRGWIVMDTGPVHGLEFGTNKPLADRVLALLRMTYDQGGYDAENKVAETLRNLLKLETDT